MILTLFIAPALIYELHGILYRPYNGTAILFHKALANKSLIIPHSNYIVTVIKAYANNIQLLLLIVFLPIDHSDAKSHDSYEKSCSVIEAIIAQSNASHLCIVGDINCPIKSRFYPIFNMFVLDNNLLIIF